MEYYLAKDELYHYGIPGQKWGVRRYQNPDGSLTEEGLKRYRKLSSGEYIMTSNGTYKYRKAADGTYIRTTRSERKALQRAKEPKLRGIKASASKLKTAADDKASIEDIEKEKKNLDKKVQDYTNSQKPIKIHSPREKDIKQLTDKQLEKYIQRMRLEKDAANIRKEVNSLDPKPISKGKQFMDMMTEKVIVPVAQDAGRKFIDAVIKKISQDNKSEPDKYAEAKKESDYMNNLANIENKKADYNKTKALNKLFEETKDSSVYNNNKNNNNNKNKENKNNNGKGQFTLSDKQVKRISEMFKSGESISEIADSMGTSIELVSKYLFGKDK